MLFRSQPGLVRRIAADGVSVLIIEHVLEAVMRLSARIVVLNHGQVIALGSPAQLIDGLGADQIIEFRAGAGFDPARLGSLPGVAAVQAKNGGHRLTVSRVAEALPALMAELTRQSVALENLTTHQPTLEDVFLKLTGRGLRDD